MRLCWADRLAIVWLAFLNLLLFLMWVPGEGLVPYLHAILSLGWLHAMLFFVGAPWAFLRFSGWAFRGTRRA
jgi:hypothetical protein